MSTPKIKKTAPTPEIPNKKTKSHKKPTEFGDILSGFITESLETQQSGHSKANKKKFNDPSKVSKTTEAEKATPLPTTKDNKKAKVAQKADDKKPKATKAQTQDLTDEQLEAIDLKKKIRNRHLLLAKDHIRRPEFNDKEKQLLRTATKGVVTLFNAIAKQQKEKKILQESKLNDDIKDEYNKSSSKSFLEFLEKSKKKHIKSSGNSESDENSDSDTAQKPVTWKAFDENYLLGGKDVNKLSSWDKRDSDVDSSEESSD